MAPGKRTLVEAEQQRLGPSDGGPVTGSASRGAVAGTAPPATLERNGATEPQAADSAKVGATNPLIDRVAGRGTDRDRAVQRSPSSADAVNQAGMWEHTFGEASTPVGKLGRVQAPKGVFLRERPLPAAPSPSAPVPFNGLLFVERRTNQGAANERWCYVIATELGIAGFCEERYLAIDPPEPTATLRRTSPGERIATIAEQEYGLASHENNSRLYVQALYLANRDRAGVKLEHVDLSFKERALRGEEERQTLEVYKGATVIAGTSLWVPGKPFIEQLKAAGAVTGGSTLVTEAWDTAKAAVGAVVDGAKYVAGFVVGLLEGAYSAIVDLFKGAVDMVDAVVKVVWNLVAGNPGRVKAMASAWVDKMRGAWEHRSEIADEFLKKWNAESAWDRGVFQGEVLGWVTMTVLLILLTMGEDAPAALSGIAVRWPQLVTLLKTVDTLGDVTTYLGAAAKAVKLPSKAAQFTARKFGKAERAADQLGETVGRAAKDAELTTERVVSHGAEGSHKHEPPAGAHGGPGAAHIHDEAFSVNRTFERSDKHAARDRVVAGRKVAKEPIDGQAALDFSFQVSGNSPRRIGIDVQNKEFVVFDRTGNKVVDKQAVGGVFHGHVRTWDELEMPMRKALEDRGLVKNGKIVVDPARWMP